MLDGGEPSVWLFFAIGLAYQLLVLALLLRRFHVVVYR